MSSSPAQLLSPCPTEFSRDDSATPERSLNTAHNMLKITALLNPSERSGRGASISPPPTPAFTQASSTASTPIPQTPLATTSQGRTKLIKDAAVFLRGTAKGSVKYPPYECTEDSICLSTQATEELARQHERFSVFPNGRNQDGLIADFQRRIPYSSDKKRFHCKTNRDAFEGKSFPPLCVTALFQYTFRVPPNTVKDQPGDFHKKEHVVMWDYQVGLVRITPFFKALRHTKTTPAKSITTNPGLKELSHSITGGALAAQGYWMPYACARALCLTFCYDIRWALTPIFGTSFIRECLHPGQAGFGKFKINSETLRCAQLEAEGWVSDASSRDGSPAVSNGYGPDIPRSVPQLAPAPQPNQLRPRPTFKAGSPFASDSDQADGNYVHTGYDSPELSPKSSRHLPSHGWASVNRREEYVAPPPPNNTPRGSLSHALLDVPRDLPATAWRALEDAARKTESVKMPTGQHDKHRSHKRQLSVQAVADADYSAVSPLSDSESDSLDVGGQPRATKKRQRRTSYKPTSPSQSGSSTPAEMREAGKSTKYNAQDARAAQWLLNLSVRDSQLAYGPSEVKGQKRKASGF
ncbi:hypothetical protein LTR17_008842 [Elasticomyces elasticus]|nr:hypothetical protein LTR17_008842 [Elasticomyces elasticus]